MDEWKKTARWLLKNELYKQRLGFKELSRLLEDVGVSLGSAQLSNKVNRGTFSFIFFLQCMRVLKVDVVRLHDSELERQKRIRRARSES